MSNESALGVLLGVSVQLSVDAATKDAVTLYGLGDMMYQSK